MRKTVFGVLAVTSLWLPGLASAQAPPPSGPAVATDLTRAEIEAAVARGVAALRPGTTVSDRLLSLADTGKYNVAVAVVTRAAGSDTRVLSHDRITEVYYILRGSGTQVTGAVVGGTRQDTSKTIGPGLSGAQPLGNARSGRLGPGDVQIIPPGVGHGWTSIDPGGIEYLVFRVDPDRVLALPQ